MQRYSNTETQKYTIGLFRLAAAPGQARAPRRHRSRFFFVQIPPGRFAPRRRRFFWTCVRAREAEAAD